ncbi:MAG: hypothetical protein KGQ67_02445 [Betaproteobacteria bacterium]|nr:hypothetical protein [Betaproteobacteria bacterium]
MNPITLLCAGAAPDADPAGALRLPPGSALQRLLAAGRVSHDRQLSGDPLPELPEDDWLRAEFGVPAGSAIQAFGGVRHGLTPPWWGLRPCHLHLGIDHALLTDPAQLALEPAESAELARSAAAAFEAAGLRLHAPGPEAWYALGAPWDLQCWPWTLASGRHVIAYQPAGPAARAWRRLLTEVQMGWHEHPVNQAREQTGRRPVNALWLDGFVAGPPAAPVRGLLISHCPALAGLASAAGWQVCAHDQPLPDWGRDAGPVLVDLDAWRAPRRLGDAHAWRQAWAEADAWLDGPRWHALRAAATGPLRVVLTGERRVLTLAEGTGRRWRWRWWRRFDALAALAAPAA